MTDTTVGTRIPALRALPLRVGALRGWRRAGLAVLMGIALTLAQPPVSAWPMLAVGWSVLLWLLDGTESARAAARLGWFAGSGFFLSGVSWVGEAFLVEAGRVWWYLPLMPLAVAALGCGLALFWALGFWVARRLPGGGWRRAVALGLAMLTVETLRGTILTGFPWALQSYGWVETPVMQLAAVMGAPALGGLTIAVAALLGTGARAAAIAALLILAAWGFGTARLATPAEGDPGPTVRLVQPNIDQFDRWAPENLVPIFDTLVALTAEPSAAPAADPPRIVIWPEVAVTFLLDRSPEAIDIATGALPEGAVLAAGSVRAEPATPRARYFNSLLFFDSDGTPLETYDKRVLTPFGEYVPYAWILERLGIGTLGEGLSGFTPGTVPGPFSLPGLPPVAVLICYEIIFPGLTRRTAAGADWIIQSTNDAWFGESFGPHQHLAKARVRAIETGLPVARAANTGISAMIDPRGRMPDSLGLLQRGVIDAPLPARLPRPPYARIGDAPPMIALALIACIILLMGEHTRRRWE